MDIPAAIAAETALARQNVALSVVKSNAEQSEQLANIIEQTVQSAPVNGSRGANVNIKA
ncbi:MAG: hypothetical protein ACTHOO_09140 [Alcanivorax sp.]